MVKRIIPVNIYDTATMEQWLSQMADEGLILHSFSGKKALFQDEYCQRVKYRLVPNEEKRDEPYNQMKEQFEENGWSFIATLQETFFVFMNKDEHPKPIPFSKEDERQIYEVLKRKKRKGMLFSGVASIFWLSIQLVMIFVRLDEYILDSQVYTSYVYIIMFILNMMAAIREYRSYMLIHRKLEGGNLGEEDSPYIPTTKWIRTETILNIIIFVFMVIPIMAEIHSDNEAMEVSKGDVPFAYVSLEEIETAEMEKEYRNEATYVESRTSFFAPTQFEIDQNGRTNYTLNGKWQGYEAEMRLNYIELRYKFLANQTLQAMMRHRDATKLEKEDLDGVWIAKGSSGIATRIFLLKENKILEIVYWGDGKILSHLNEFSDILQTDYHVSKSI